MSKNQCLHFFSVAINLILFKLTDKEEMNNILDVFEFWPDWTTDNRVTCPCPEYPKKYIFLVENYSKYVYDCERSLPFGLLVYLGLSFCLVFGRSGLN